MASVGASGGWHLCCRLILAAASLAGCLDAYAVTAVPLPFPVYVACRIRGQIRIDGELTEPAWRESSLGWGLSHALEPNILCPDPTLFRIGYDEKWLYLSLACYKRQIEDDLPDHIWKPRETDIMDLQATRRYARMRGVIPPVNTADVLICREGRAVTLHFEPPGEPSARVHDSLGERELRPEMIWAYAGGPDDVLWTAEVRCGWGELGFGAPSAGENWALNVYRDIRFFSNWAFIAWMRRWDKAEYSKYDPVDRFGRLIFVDRPELKRVEQIAKGVATRRGPVRVFTPDAYLLIDSEGRVLQRSYAERLRVVRAYANELLRDLRRIRNDLPYYPFFSQKEPGEHLKVASRKIGRLRTALDDPPAWDDPASSVARIRHALPQAEEGLYTYKKERLYRGLPE